MGLASTLGAVHPSPSLGEVAKFFAVAGGGDLRAAFAFPRVRQFPFSPQTSTQHFTQVLLEANPVMLVG